MLCCYQLIQRDAEAVEVTFLRVWFTTNHLIRSHVHIGPKNVGTFLEENISKELGLRRCSAGPKRRAGGAMAEGPHGIGV